MRLSPLLLSLSILSAAGCGAPDGPAMYVGGSECAGCHERETAVWTGSDHDLAMAPASGSTVLAPFEGEMVEHAGIETTFFRDRERFMVRTDGPDGEQRDFEVEFVFGVRPLQQVLVPLPGGRLQALPYAWDARPGETGWYHLYAGDSVTVRDPLHWTGAFQNWNHMCADCHSTNLVKGYDAGSRTFSTSWSDIDVSCEACHGPASHHVEWARRRDRFPLLYPEGDTLTEAAMGLAVSVHDRALWAWEMNPETGVAQRTRPRGTVQDIPTCARCHSRRASLRPEYLFGRPFEDTHILEPPIPPLYHSDGQVLEEDYVYASFLQSRMYRAGVACGNCHDPHSLRTRADGNLLCRTCHDSARFDTTSHHGHAPGTPGSLCVDCHMPETVYMGVDARRDHSFSIPRPALTLETGVPNACTGCHTDRTDDWAVRKLADLGQAPQSPIFALAFHAARSADPGAEDLLLAVFSDTSEAVVRRAGALRLLRSAAGPRSVPAVERALASPEPYLRWAALDLLGLFPPDDRARLGSALLEDPVLSVRIEAARVLASADSRRSLLPTDRPAFERALAEYEDVLRMDADRPEAQANLGIVLAALGRTEEAERALLEAIRLSPWFAQAIVNLADLYRAAGRDAEGETVLRDGLGRLPESADLHHSLGLLLVRARRTNEALGELGEAARLRPDEVRFGYVHAVALHSAGRDREALAALDEMLDRRPFDPELLYLAATVHRDRGDAIAALEAAERLLEAAPNDPRGRALVDLLGKQD